MAIRCDNCGARHMALPGNPGPRVPRCHECPVKLHDLDAFEIWRDGQMFVVYGATAPVARFASLKKCLEWVAAQPDPKGSKDRGPIRYARHCAKCLLAQEQLPTELTPAGEQFVIPGCERNASPKAKQLGLFG